MVARWMLLFYRREPLSIGRSVRLAGRGDRRLGLSGLLAAWCARWSARNPSNFGHRRTVTRWSLTTPTDTLSVRWRSAPPLPTLAPRAKVSESQRPARFTRERHTIAAESSHVSRAPTVHPSQSAQRTTGLGAS